MNKRTKNTRALRRIGVGVYTSAVRANIFFPPPKVLLNGPGKSGTHLLNDCLSLMPKMMFSGRHFALSEFVIGLDGLNGAEFFPSEPPAALDEPRLRTFLERCPQGMFVSAHAKFHPVLQAMLEELQFKQILLLRDPRDIVVSHTLFVKQEVWHYHHKFYNENLRDDKERIMATIKGFEWDDYSRASIREVFDGFVAWLGKPHTLAVRFEDLVGSRGGGDSETQLAEVKRVGNFVDRSLTREQTLRIAQQMYGKGLTFRKGSVGDWRNHFDEEHRRVFKELAGDLLIELGYEQDVDW